MSLAYLRFMSLDTLKNEGGEYNEKGIHRYNDPVDYIWYSDIHYSWINCLEISTPDNNSHQHNPVTTT